MRSRSKLQTVTTPNNGGVRRKSTSHLEEENGYDTREEAIAADTGVKAKNLFPGGSNVYNVGEYMVDDVTSNYFAKVKAGEIIPTNYMSQTKEAAPAVIYYSWCTQSIVLYKGKWHPTNEQVTYAFVVRPTNHRGSPPSKTAAVNKATAKLKDGFMDVLTSASEFHKTLSLVLGFRQRMKDTIIKLVRDFGSTKKGKEIRKLSSVMGAFSSYWLEVRYGWRILMYDYNSICKYLNEQKQGYHRKSFRVTENSSSSRTSELARYTHFKVNQTLTTEWTTRAGATGRVNLSAPGKLDPITTAWELIPLSFVIDMFWNVGTCIRAMTPVSGAILEDTWASVEGVTTIELEFIDTPVENAYHRVVGYNQETVGQIPQFITKERSRESPSWVPEPVNLPDMSQLIDIGSLTVVLWSHLTRLVRRNNKR